jgi:polyisoprenoid-binding protein YceI
MFANIMFTSVLFVSCSSELDNKPAAVVNNSVVEKSANKDKPKNTNQPKEESSETNKPVGSLSMLEGSSIGFVGSKAIGDHSGGFNKITGSASLDEKGKLNSFKAIIDMQSTFSDNKKLTIHLLKEDFFNVSKHPKSFFSSTTIKDGKVTGILELRGKKNVITFPAEIVTDDNKTSIQAEFTINRKLWDITYNGKSDNMIKDEVLLKVNVAYGKL